MSLLKNAHEWLKAEIQARGGESYERLVGDRKRRLFADVRGSVLEIGAGAGPNLRYLPRDVRYLGVEPNRHVHRHLLQEAQQYHITAEVCADAAEAISAPDASMDAVIGTLVLCSVRDPGRALAEIRRVLRPGGMFYFMEHVAAPRGTWLRRAQRAVKPVWCVCGGGCHPDRETYAAIEAAGFAGVRIEHFRLPIPLMGPHISGIAVR